MTKSGATGSLIAWVLLCASAVTSLADTHSGGAASQPASPGDSPHEDLKLDADVSAAVAKVMGAKPSPLSTGPNSASDRFHFVARVQVPEDKGGSSTEFLVERNGDDVGVLVRSNEGLPYYYATKGLFVGLDHGHGGRLVTYEGGAPAFAFGVREDGGGVVFQLDYLKNEDAPFIKFDPQALLSAALKKAEGASYDSTRRTLTVKTKRSTVTVVFAPAERADTFMVQEFTTRDGRGGMIGIRDIHVERKLCVNVLGINKDSLKRLNLPTRDLAETSEPIRFMVPPDFGTEPNEKLAARRLAGLFPAGALPTSRPVETP